MCKRVQNRGRVSRKPSNYVNNQDQCVKCNTVCTDNNKYAKGCIGDNPGECTVCNPCTDLVPYNGKIYNSVIQEDCAGEMDSICVPILPCTEQEYRDPETPTTQNWQTQTCNPCSEACPPNQFKSKCGSGYGMSATCRQCLPCDDNMYRVGCGPNEWGDMVQGECQPLPLCPVNHWRDRPDSTPSTDPGTCTPCKSCSTSENPLQYREGCSTSGEGICKPCECNEGFYIVSGCHDGVTPPICGKCPECSYNQFRADCAGDNAGTCKQCYSTDSTDNSCEEDEYIEPNCKDTQTCLPCSELECGVGEYLAGCGNGFPGTCIPCNEDSRCALDRKVHGCHSQTSGTCVECNQENTDDTHCNECPIGAKAASNSKCSCAPGFKKSSPDIPQEFDSTSTDPCTECPSGTFSATAGVADCTACPLGSFTTTAGATTCTTCPLGDILGEGVEFESPSEGTQSDFWHACKWICVNNEWQQRDDGKLGCEECNGRQKCSAGHYLISCEVFNNQFECAPCNTFSEVEASEIAKWATPDSGNYQVGSSTCEIHCDQSIRTRDGHWVLHGEGTQYLCPWVCDNHHVRDMLPITDQQPKTLVNGICTPCNNLACPPGYKYHHPQDPSACPNNMLKRIGSFVADLDTLQMTTLPEEWDNLKIIQEQFCTACPTPKPANAEWLNSPSEDCVYKCNIDENDRTQKPINHNEVQTTFDRTLCEWTCDEGYVLGAPGTQQELRCTSCNNVVTENLCPQGDYLEKCDGRVAKCLSCQSAFPMQQLKVNEEWVVTPSETGTLYGKTSCKRQCMDGYVPLDGTLSENGCIECLPEEICQKPDTYIEHANGGFMECNKEACRNCTVCNHATEFKKKDCGFTTDTDCRQCKTCLQGVEYATEPCSQTDDTKCTQCTPCQDGYYKTGGCTGEQDTTCSNCPVGNYCGADNVPKQCPQGSTSRQDGQPTVTAQDCECIQDNERLSNTPPFACEQFECTDENTYQHNHQCFPCPVGSSAPPRSIGMESCKCNHGQYRKRTENTDTFQCITCDTQCPNIPAKERLKCTGVEWANPLCECIQNVPNVLEIQKNVECTPNCAAGSENVKDNNTPFLVYDQSSRTRVRSIGRITAVTSQMQIQGGIEDVQSPRGVNTGQIYQMLLVHSYDTTPSENAVIIWWTLANVHCVYETRYVQHETNKNNKALPVLGNCLEPGEACTSGCENIAGPDIKLSYPKVVPYRSKTQNKHKNTNHSTLNTKTRTTQH
eukprot:2606333-Rhodomonas_salina.3